MKVVKVTSIQKVNPTQFNEGTVFLTKNTIALLVNGKIEPLVKQSDIRKLIREELKRGAKNG